MLLAVNTNMVSEVARMELFDSLNQVTPCNGCWRTPGKTVAVIGKAVKQVPPLDYGDGVQTSSCIELYWQLDSVERADCWRRER